MRGVSKVHMSREPLSSVHLYISGMGPENLLLVGARSAEPVETDGGVGILGPAYRESTQHVSPPHGIAHFKPESTYGTLLWASCGWRTVDGGSLDGEHGHAVGEDGQLVLLGLALEQLPRRERHQAA